MPPRINILIISFDLLQSISFGVPLCSEILVSLFDLLQNRMLMCGGPPAHVLACSVVVAMVRHDDV